MKYKIVFSSEARKRVKALDPNHFDFVLQKIFDITDDPYRYLDRLKGMNLWKLRVGDYRVIASIDIKNKKIVIATLGQEECLWKIKPCQIWNSLINYFFANASIKEPLYEP